MTFLEELKELLNNFLYWIYLLIFFAVFFFSFGLTEVTISSYKIGLPLLSQESFAVQFFKKIQADLLPQDVSLIVTNPMSAFVSQVLISLFLAFILSFPFLLYRLIKYLSPALSHYERGLVLKSILPSLFLFIGGCLFSYYFLIPATFNILFPYATSIGAVPFFSVNEFVSSVLGLVIATGVMFQLPVFMVMLSFANFVKSSFWISKWRHALVFFLIFSAIITPDGTGVTMLLLALPLLGLYAIGCGLTARFDKSKINT